MKWYRHPIELWLRWWGGYDQPDWRARLLRPFLGEETWEYKWVRREEVEAGWEKVGIHPVHDMKGRKAQLVRRRIK